MRIYKKMLRLCLFFTALVWATQPVLAQGDSGLLFAVVTKVPTDKHKVSARVFFGGQVADGILLVPEGIASNPVWRNLEVCHSLRGEAVKTPEGYRLESAQVIDSSQLPMVLQGIAGDCLVRKALEMIPPTD
jgi:hypothetical protein